jgi:phosphopantothenate synthetase
MGTRAEWTSPGFYLRCFETTPVDRAIEAGTGRLLISASPVLSVNSLISGEKTESGHK